MEIAVLKAQVTKCEVRIGEFDRQLKNATYYLRQLDNGTRV